MAMRACGACGRKYRGKGSRAVVLEGPGAGTGCIVCPTCSSRSTSVLTNKTARCKCGDVATTCGGCAQLREARDQAAVVGDLVKRLEGQLKARARSSAARGLTQAEREREDGYVEGFESCIEQLRRST